MLRRLSQRVSMVAGAKTMTAARSYYHKVVVPPPAAAASTRPQRLPSRNALAAMGKRQKPKPAEATTGTTSSRVKKRMRTQPAEAQRAALLAKLSQMRHSTGHKKNALQAGRRRHGLSAATSALLARPRTWRPLRLSHTTRPRAPKTVGRATIGLTATQELHRFVEQYQAAIAGVPLATQMALALREDAKQHKHIVSPTPAVSKLLTTRYGTAVGQEEVASGSDTEGEMEIAMMLASMDAAGVFANVDPEDLDLEAAEADMLQRAISDDDDEVDADSGHYNYDTNANSSAEDDGSDTLTMEQIAQLKEGFLAEFEAHAEAIMQQQQQEDADGTQTLQPQQQQPQQQEEEGDSDVTALMRMSMDETQRTETDAGASRVMYLSMQQQGSRHAPAREASKRSPRRVGSKARAELQGHWSVTGAAARVCWAYQRQDLVEALGHGRTAKHFARGITTLTETTPNIHTMPQPKQRATTWVPSAAADPADPLSLDAVNLDSLFQTTQVEPVRTAHDLPDAAVAAFRDVRNGVMAVGISAHPTASYEPTIVTLLTARSSDDLRRKSTRFAAAVQHAQSALRNM